MAGFFEQYGHVSSSSIKKNPNFCILTVEPSPKTYSYYHISKLFLLQNAGKILMIMERVEQTVTSANPNCRTRSGPAAFSNLNILLQKSILVLTICFTEGKVSFFEASSRLISALIPENAFSRASSWFDVDSKMQHEYD